jgi:cell fate (sporulation/competence/biofilm development) regulator YlbF (YheA/YmcA/DUF963 family)
MAADMDQIMKDADKLGQLVAQHPSVTKYKAAQKALESDADAKQLLTQFQQAFETLLRQEQSGMPVSEQQQRQLESLQMKMSSHLKIKAYNIAQVEFVDLLRKVGQTFRKPLGADGEAIAGEASGHLA